MSKNFVSKMLGHTGTFLLFIFWFCFNLAEAQQAVLKTLQPCSSFSCDDAGDLKKTGDTHCIDNNRKYKKLNGCRSNFGVGRLFGRKKYIISLKRASMQDLVDAGYVPKPEIAEKRIKTKPPAQDEVKNPTENDCFRGETCRYMKLRVHTRDREVERDDLIRFDKCEAVIKYAEDRQKAKSDLENTLKEDNKELKRLRGELSGILVQCHNQCRDYVVSESCKYQDLGLSSAGGLAHHLTEEDYVYLDSIKKGEANKDEADKLMGKVGQEKRAEKYWFTGKKGDICELMLNKSEDCMMKFSTAKESNCVPPQKEDLIKSYYDKLKAMNEMEAKLTQLKSTIEQNGEDKCRIPPASNAYDITKKGDDLGLECLEALARDCTDLLSDEVGVDCPNCNDGEGAGSDGRPHGKSASAEELEAWMRNQPMCAIYGHCPPQVSKGAQIIGAAAPLVNGLFGFLLGNKMIQNQMGFASNALNSCVNSYNNQLLQAKDVGLPPLDYPCNPGVFGMGGLGGMGMNPFMMGGLGGMGMNPFMMGGLGGMGMNPFMMGGLGGMGLGAMGLGLGLSASLGLGMNPMMMGGMMNPMMGGMMNPMMGGMMNPMMGGMMNPMMGGMMNPMMGGMMNPMMGGMMNPMMMGGPLGTNPWSMQQQGLSNASRMNEIALLQMTGQTAYQMGYPNMMSGMNMPFYSMGSNPLMFNNPMSNGGLYFNAGAGFGMPGAMMNPYGLNCGFYQSGIPCAI